MLTIQINELSSKIDLVTVQQRISNIAGVEGYSVAVTTLTDVRTENNKVNTILNIVHYNNHGIDPAQEVAMRLHSSIANDDGVFYTDLNGLQLVRRKTVVKLPLQGNFYPMPTMALLQDSIHRLSILSAQSHGVASLEQGLFLSNDSY